MPDTRDREPNCGWLRDAGGYCRRPASYLINDCYRCYAHGCRYDPNGNGDYADETYVVEYLGLPMGCLIRADKLLEAREVVNAEL